METEVKKTKGFTKSLEKFADKVGHYGSKIAANKYLGAIRDSFATILPLVIIGAMASLINNVFIKPDGLIGTYIPGAETSESWYWFNFYIGPIFVGIANIAYYLMTIYILFLMGYFLTTKYGLNGLIGGALTVGAWMTLQPFAAGPAYLKYTTEILDPLTGAVTGYAPSYGDQKFFLGVNGIFTGIIFGILVPMLYNFFMKMEKIKIKMPDGVPPMVANSFNSLLPAALTILSFGLIQPLWGAIAWSSGIGQAANFTNPDGTAMYSGIYSNYYYFLSAFYAAIALPFIEIATNPAIIFTVIFGIGLFWFCGVSGSSVFAPILYPIYEANGIKNAEAYSAYGAPVYNDASNSWEFLSESGQVMMEANMWSKASMDAFVFMGGAGTTIALIFLIFFISRSRMNKQITKVAAGPAFFNINEPVTFGLPIVLNVVWLIPFTFGPAIISMVAYFATASGWLAPSIAIIPWTTPLFIAGFLTTLDPTSITVTFINLALTMLMYLPFLLLELRRYKKEYPDDLDAKTMAYGLWMTCTFRHTKYKQEVEKINAENAEAQKLRDAEILANISSTASKIEKIGGKQINQQNLELFDKNITKDELVKKTDESEDKTQKANKPVDKK